MCVSFSHSPLSFIAMTHVICMIWRSLHNIHLNGLCLPLFSLSFYFTRFVARKNIRRWHCRCCRRTLINKYDREHFKLYSKYVVSAFANGLKALFFANQNNHTTEWASLQPIIIIIFMFSIRVSSNELCWAHVKLYLKCVLFHFILYTIPVCVFVSISGYFFFFFFVFSVSGIEGMFEKKKISWIFSMFICHAWRWQ